MQNFLEPSRLAALIDVPTIHCAAFQFQLDAYHPDLFPSFNVLLPASLTSAVNKRQAEFLAGRVAAKQALKSLDFGTRQIAIGEHRAPVWPIGTVGSISHTHQLAMCAVARDTEMRYLGIDLETVLTKTVAEQVKHNVLSDAELRYFNDSPLPLELMITLVFSAKESLFKALYPFVKQYFDFEVAQLERICIKTQFIEFRLTQTLASNLPRNSLISGRFYFVDNLVLTCIYQPS